MRTFAVIATVFLLGSLGGVLFISPAAAEPQATPASDPTPAAATATATAPAPAGATQGSPREITPKEAVAMALRRNLGLKYDRLAPELSGASEAMARSVTDTRFFGEAGVSGEVDRLSAERLNLPLTVDSTVEAGVGLRKAFFSGTSLEARLGGLLGVGHQQGDTDLTVQGSLQLTVRQALLRGADARANRVDVITARLERTAAEHELRRKAEVLAAEVLRAYWDLYAAQANLQIQQVALERSQRTLGETQELITLKRIAASERVSAEHQVKIQERAVLLARQAVQDLQDRLTRLIGFEDPRSLVTPALVAKEAEGLSRPPDIDSLQQLAFAERGDYLSLRKRESARQEQARAAGNLLLPKLDLVGTAGVNGGRRPSWNPIGEDPVLSGRVTWSVGLILEVPLGNQEARARQELATVQVQRARVAVQRQEQAISEELKVAWRSVAAAEELVTLTRQAVAVAEIKLQNEMQRFRAGRGTAQILSLVEGDLVREQQNHEQAVASYHKTLVDVWAAAGSLLGRLGSQA